MTVATVKYHVIGTAETDDEWGAAVDAILENASELAVIRTADGYSWLIWDDESGDVHVTRPYDESEASDPGFTGTSVTLPADDVTLPVRFSAVVSGYYAEQLRAHGFMVNSL